MTSGKQSKNSAQPKINTEPQTQNSDEVKKHNDEVDRRRGNSDASKEDEPVEKGFHSGELLIRDMACAEEMGGHG